MTKVLEQRRKGELTLRQAASLLNLDVVSAMGRHDLGCRCEPALDFERKQFYYIVCKLAKQIEDEIGPEKVAKSMALIKAGKSDIPKEAKRLGISEGDLVLLVRKSNVLSIGTLERDVRKLLAEQDKSLAEKGKK